MNNKSRFGGFFLKIVLFILLLLLAILFSLSSGEYPISFQHVLASLSQVFGLPFYGDVTVPPDEQAVLWHIRFPRTLTGILVGAGLAASGATLQGIFSNPLADPGIIGVSSGASLGAIISILLGASMANIFLMPAFAFVGALAAVTLTVMLSIRHGKIPIMTLLLSGVVVGMLLSACTAAILTMMDNQKMHEYLFWTVGGLDYRRWEHVLLGVVPIGLGITCMIILARHLNVLVLGEIQAKSVGMQVAKYRLIFLVLATLTTATAVCISGNIGFVGLVVPHAMRFLVGPDHRRLLPASVLAGAVFLVFCDTLGRVIMPPAEVRVGIMTAFLGSPYFLYLLRKYKGRVSE